MPDKRIPELDPLASVNGTIMIPGYDPVTDTTYRINLSDVNPGLSTANNSWQPAPAVYNEDDIVQSEDRLWASNIDGNTDIPPYEGVEWREISRSKSGLTLYVPGTFMDADVYVVSNYTGSYNLYRLINPTRPFESADLETEVTGGDWEAFGEPAATITADSGLTKTGDNIQWGGPLLADVSIDGGGTHYIFNTNLLMYILSINGGGPLIIENQVGDIDIKTNPGGGNISISSYLSASLFGVLSSSVQSSFMTITMGDDTFGSSKLTDSRTGANQTGLEYGGDYSANYTDRSLVDKAWVLSVIGGG